MSGRASNTIVVLLSDNGCAAYIPDLCSSVPLSGGKLTYLEGGVRVPFLMRWPGHLKSGTVFAKPVSSLDVFPTAVKAAGLALPADRVYDGQDIVDQVTRDTKRGPLFWRTQPITAMREGDWKFVRDLEGQEYLYDVRRDPTESVNLITREPAQAQAMRTAHAAWAANIGQPLWKPRRTDFEFGGRKFSFLP